MKLNNIRGIMIDVDGTLFRGNNLLPGVKEFFNFLKERSIAYQIVTNNTKSAKTYKKRFKSSGISISEKNIFTCTDSTRIYLLKNKEKIKSVYVIGKKDLLEAVASTGVEIRDDITGFVDAVIVGGDFDLNYNKLKKAVLYLQRGALLIGSNGDVLIPTEVGLVPEAGMTIAALVSAYPVTPIMLGKPESYFFEIAADRLGVPVEETAILGDRLDTDIAGGNSSGLCSILVCTGVDNKDCILTKDIHPNYVFMDLFELMKSWENEE